MITNVMGHDTTALENNGLQATPEEASEIIRLILRKLNRANSWDHRAQVKKNGLNEVLLLDDSKDDFLLDLLPFKDHPSFLEASEDMKKTILSCGWLAYNEKTVNIEAEVVAPACMHIIYGEVPGLQDWVSRQIAGQMLVDESYHILLVIKAGQITRERRGLLSVPIPESNLIIKMEEYKAEFSEKWQKVLIQMAASIVSEVFISDYLRLLSNDMTIQPFNRLTVDIHRRDEISHSSTFKDLAKSIYIALGKKEREFFMDVLPKPVHWFASLELDVWSAMLQEIKFPWTETLIHDCWSINEKNLARVDYSGLITLAEELGMLHGDRGKESFYREGLIS